MILILVFNRIHFLQADLIRQRAVDEVIIFGPSHLDVDIEFGPSSFDPSTFLSCIKSKDFKSLIKYTLLWVDTIYVHDLAYPCCNLLVGSVLSKNPSVGVKIIYDGSVNISNHILNAKDRVKDVLKFGLARVFCVHYLVRKNLFSGLDFGFVCRTHAADSIELYRASMSPVVSDRFQAEYSTFNGVVYIFMGNKLAFKRYYDYVFLPTLSIIKYRFPGVGVKTLFRSGLDTLAMDVDRVDRSFPGETGEEVCFRCNPTVVISSASSVLLNLRILGFDGELVSIGADRLCEAFPDDYVLGELLEMFSKFDIEVVMS